MGLLSSAGSVILILLGFGALIFIHELGHFLAAKWAGIRTEGFAVGMGPVVTAWRKGIGFTLGSSERKVIELAGKPAAELSDAELAQHGLGETEYSLRWLPIGGFVKMLGQEDLSPNSTSADPRSYNVAPIGKRMIVVSAGVVMNALLAVILFMVAFMAGVKFYAPMIGGVDPSLPAGRAMPDNAAALGVTEPGLAAGDEVLTIDGAPARTFDDVRVAIAMAKPGSPVRMHVARHGYDEPLEFTITPEPNSNEEGLLSIGVVHEQSNRLHVDDRRHTMRDALEGLGLTEAGVEPGMELFEAGGEPVSTLSDLHPLLRSSDGTPLISRWQAVGDDGDRTGPVVETPLVLRPRYQEMFSKAASGALVAEPGLFGLAPLVVIREVAESSQNLDLLQPGDVIIKAAGTPFPRRGDLLVAIQSRKGGTVDLLLERNGVERSVSAPVDRQGRLGVVIAAADERPTLAGSLNRILSEENADDSIATPAASLDLLPGTELRAVGETPISSFRELRVALVGATTDAAAASTGADIELLVAHPTPGRETERVMLQLSAADVSALHELGWTPELAAGLFQPSFVTLSAEEGPLQAMTMGIGQTHRMMMLTYLTIDRLFRGSVKVDQLRGPVGIIDLGSKILPRGFMYFLFFLGLISVNLAVLNFLPLPIVDGGLFLFLLYEKFKGKPPSIGFQNAATIAGLCLIGAVFLVTFYHDIMRLL